MICASRKGYSTCAVRRRGAGALADGVRRELHRSVREIRDHHFVARRQRHRAEDGVGPRGDVRHEDEIVGPGADELRHRHDRFAQSRHRSPRRRLLSVELAQHEPRWMPLHFVAERLLPVQHTSRDDTDRAVIEIGGCWIQRPVLEHRAAEGHAAIIRGGTRRTVMKDPSGLHSGAQWADAVRAPLRRSSAAQVAGVHARRHSRSRPRDRRQRRALQRGELGPPPSTAVSRAGPAGQVELDERGEQPHARRLLLFPLPRGAAAARGVQRSRAVGQATRSR